MPRDFQRQRVYDAEQDAGITFRAFEAVSVPPSAATFCGISHSFDIGPPCKHRTGSHRGITDASGVVTWYRARSRKVWSPDALRTVGECQDFVDRAMMHPDWVGPGDIVVTSGRRARWATARPDPNRIVLPLWARVPEVICHELAHHAIGVGDARDCAAHGPEFCAEYVNLVHRHIGVTEARELMGAFGRYGVQVDTGRMVG